MAGDENTRHGSRAESTLLKGFDDHLAGIEFIVFGDFGFTQVAGAGYITIEIVGMGGAKGGQVEIGLGPGRRPARMGVDDAADFRIAAVQGQVGRCIA